MKRKFSIYHFLVALMLSTLILPGFVGASATTGETGSLTIHKFEQDPAVEGQVGSGVDGDGSANQSAPGTALGGVTFELIQTHSYDPETDEWAAVTSSPQTYTETTDSDGKIVINNISLGRYKVQETAWPDNVVGDDTEYFVDIPMTNADGTGPLNYDVHIYPKNETIRGGATLIKYDNDTGNTLDGVTFKVFDENDNPLKDDDGNDIVLISENGMIEIDGLGYGEYYFKETETVDGYLLKGTKKHFTVDSQDSVTELSLRNYHKPEVEKKVDKDAVNRGEEVTFTISVTLPADISEYDSFSVIDTLDERLEYVAGSQSNPAGFKFSKNGQTLTWEAEDFSQLEPGVLDITFKTKVKEDATANEPIPNEGEIEYNNGHEEGGEKTPEVTIIPTVGSLAVKKVDGDSEKALPGAEFELRQGDTLIATGTSDSGGNVDFNGATDELDYGTYQLIETKAPNDYNLLRNPIEVTINDDDQSHDVELVVKNYKGGWQLPKTGGIGTMLFTFIGLSLMGGASFMFARRRNGEQA